MIKNDKVPVISIIVPVYKAESYLRTCIDSILMQTFTDFELILVNDGSPDKSGEICDSFARKDSRIKVIHKRNGGASSARNAGLAAAIGKYIGWVDADDRISPEMYSKLYNLINEYNADIAECQYYEINEDSVKKSGLNEPIISGNGNFIMKQFFKAKMKPNLWSKLYRKELWENICFPPGRNHQDFYVNVKFALMPLSYVRTSEALYYYIIRENSITTTKTARELRETIYKYEYTLGLTETCATSTLAKQYLKRDAINRLMWRYFEVSTNSKIKTQNVYNRIVRRKLGSALFTYIIFSRIPVKTKISYFLLFTNMLYLQIYLHHKFGRKSTCK